ncbi:zona pellucida sperm-binding protein 1 [Echinops telfairi]|uniref:Zona pellucida sperm-binding protein 1 n=1 Tax=Echinops telfairi TaxID=9371 RepID=A0ABM0J597_ECHTE|nr:zona pellucida sperm-binding protein 1 [Echinops telfairi]
MAWGHCVILLLVVAATLGPGLGQQTRARPGPLGLQHNHTCGAQGMQLHVVPKPGRAVHIKVVDEFGNRFDVNNCSICYHWLTSQPQGAVVFSADYKGCHVLEKDGHFHLRVVVEALLPDGRVEAAQDTTFICPKPRSPWAPATHLVPITWVSSYSTPTVRCFRDGHLLLVVSQETALAHRITLANTHLAHAPTSCPPAQKTDAFVVFRFPLTHCGTTAQVVGSQLIYENQLVSGLEVQRGPRGSVTWDSTFQLHVRCIFNVSNYLPVQASVFRAPPPGPVTQAGPLRLELRIAKDETFSSFYEEEDYPIWKLLRQPLHVEVRLLQRADPGLVLVLHQCWASPSTNPFQQPQWPVLSDGCPFNGDGYRTEMVALEKALPLPSHRQRFTVTTFAFLDKGSRRALRGPVYFFCSASACHPSGLDTCSRTCTPGSPRQRRQSSGDHRGPAGPWDIVSSPGPVGFEDVSGQEPTVGATGSPRDSSSRLLLWVPLMLLALVLVVGAGVLPGLHRTWAPQQQEGCKA